MQFQLMNIRLLTLSETEKLPYDIRICKAKNRHWWVINDEDINLPSDEQCYVDGNFGVMWDLFGVCLHKPCSEELGVRPCLDGISKEQISMLPRTKKGYIKLFDTKWIDISSYVGFPCLLKKNCLKTPYMFDPKDNNPYTCAINHHLKKWLHKKKHDNKGVSFR